MCVCVCLFVMVFYSPRGLHLKEMQLCQVLSRSDTAQHPNEMTTATCTSDQEPCSTRNCIGVQLVWRSARVFPLQCKWNHARKSTQTHGIFYPVIAFAGIRPGPRSLHSVWSINARSTDARSSRRSTTRPSPGDGVFPSQGCHQKMKTIHPIYTNDQEPCSTGNCIGIQLVCGPASCSP